MQFVFQGHLKTLCMRITMSVHFLWSPTQTHTYIEKLGSRLKKRTQHSFMQQEKFNLLFGYSVLIRTNVDGLIAQRAKGAGTSY